MTNIFHLMGPAESHLDLAPYLNLTNHRVREEFEHERGIFIAESPWVVERALQSSVSVISFLTEEKHLARVQELREQAHSQAPIYVLDTQEIEKLTGYKLTRGVLAACERPENPSLEDVLSSSSKLVVLEALVDTTNVGACFRSAAALGADAVILSPDCADPLARRSLRVSMGTVLQIPWARAHKPWPEATFELMRKHNFCCIALALEKDSIDIRELRSSKLKKKALFFGNEGFGLSSQVLAATDLKVVIPMAHDVDSLNVASSSAVAFWELFTCGEAGATGVGNGA